MCAPYRVSSVICIELKQSVSTNGKTQMKIKTNGMLQIRIVNIDLFIFKISYEILSYIYRMHRYV